MIFEAEKVCDPQKCQKGKRWLRERQPTLSANHLGFMEFFQDFGSGGYDDISYHRLIDSHAPILLLVTLLCKFAEISVA